MKKCKCGFQIEDQEDIDLLFGIVDYAMVRYCPKDGEELKEVEEEEEAS